MELPLLVLALAIVLGAVIVARRMPGGRPRGVESRLDAAAAALSSITGVIEERRRNEERFAETAVRLERLMAGSHSRGRAGENLLAAALSEFPPEMVVRDFAVAGRVCEFALRMSDGKLLPIDSKWSEVEWGSGSEIDDDLRRRIDSRVGTRVKEAAGYIDGSRTAPMAVVAVPDAVFACLTRAHEAARRSRVTIVSYSTAVPFLLSLWNLHRTFVRDLDSERMLESVASATQALVEVEDRIETQLSRGLTMAQNAAGQMRSLVSEARTALLSVDRSQRREKPGVAAAEEVG